VQSCSKEYLAYTYMSVGQAHMRTSGSTCVAGIVGEVLLCMCVWGGGVWGVCVCVFLFMSPIMKAVSAAEGCL
jgi:uncharacterized membrane protein